MSANLQQHNALAANWDPEILAQYLAGVQNAEDSDEAMSSDESDDGDFEEGTSFESMTSVMSDIAVPHPDDIASDDSAFSSEDEFAEESITDKQTTRRELVLGRPTPAIMGMRVVELKDMHIGYMKQLDDADEELAEITGVPRQVLVRREPVSGYDKPIEQKADLEAYVVELRKRSNKEIVSTDRKVLVQELVVLAQSLFRKERQIKHLRG